MTYMDEFWDDVLRASNPGQVPQNYIPGKPGLPAPYGSRLPVPTGNYPVARQLPGAVGELGSGASNSLVQQLMGSGGSQSAAGATGAAGAGTGFNMSGGGSTYIPFNPRLPQSTPGGLVPYSGGYGGPVNPGMELELFKGAGAGGAGATAAETLGEQAASAGLRGLVGKVGGMPFPSSFAGKAGLGIGLSVGGQLLGNALGKDTTAGKFAQGAGTGAALGTVAGPWGMLGGGVVGGALSLLGGGGEKGIDTKKLSKQLSGLGISSAETQQIQAMYELEKDALGEDAAKQNFVTRVNAAVTNMQAASQQLAQEKMAQSRMLASQALAGQFFQPFAQDMIQSANQRSQMIHDLLPSLPKSFRGVASAQAAGALDNATRLAHAYQAQSQMIPAMAAFQDQQSQISGIAAQLQQQGVQNALTGGATSTGASLADLLASQAGAK